MKKFILIIIVLFLICGGVGIFLSSQVQNTSIPDEAIQKVEKRDVKNYVSGEGSVKGVDRRDAFAVNGSKVYEILFKEGDKVNADSIIARSEVVVQNKTQIFEITSPINGIISRINYKVGDFTSATLAFALIEDVSKYQIELTINENDVVNIAKGQSVDIIYPAISLDQSFPGKVSFISPSPVSTSGVILYKVLVDPANFPEKLKLGMSSEVNILTAEVKDALSVPESFLIEKDDKIYLKKITWNEGKTKYELNEIEVTIGLRTDDYAEIKTGVSEGDELVEPAFTVQRGFSLFNN